MKPQADLPMLSRETYYGCGDDLMPVCKELRHAKHTLICLPQHLQSTLSLRLVGVST